MHIAAFRQVTVDRHTRVKDKALTVPLVLRLFHLGKVVQNSALQVVNVIESEFEHERRRLLAANTASTEHRQWSVRRLLGQFFRELRKFAKTVVARIKCTGKRANLHFVVIAGIDDHYFRVGYQFVPARCVHMLAGPFVGEDVGPTQRDDLGLYLHPHSSKRGINGICPACIEFFSNTELLTNPVHDRSNRFLAAGQRAVETFRRDQHGAQQALLITQCFQLIPE